MIVVIRLNLPTVLVNSSNHSRARRHNIVSNTFTVNVIFCPLKANTWRLENKSCNRNEPQQYTSTRQIMKVSNSTKLLTDNSRNHADLWPLKFALAQSNGSSFLLITQYEMPFINKSEATKRSKDRKINGKCANGTNRRSRVWPV